jgi:hypothetical protein
MPEATSAPAPTSAEQPTLESTATPSPTTAPAAATATTASSGGAPSGGELSGDQLLKIFQTSVTAYPWRWRENATQKDTQQTSTAVIEAQSGARVHVIQEHSIAEQKVIIESILITPTLYMKGTGGNPNLYKTFGATEGQWLRVPPTSPLAGFAEMVYLLGNPEQLLNSLGLTELEKTLKQGSAKFVGTEQVGNMSTSVYEIRAGSGDAAVTYRWYVGSDGRLYKMSSDSAALSTTILIEYDPSINIQPPIP